MSISFIKGSVLLFWQYSNGEKHNEDDHTKYFTSNDLDSIIYLKKDKDIGLFRASSPVIYGTTFTPRLDCLQRGKVQQRFEDTSTTQSRHCTAARLRGTCCGTL